MQTTMMHWFYFCASFVLWNDKHFNFILKNLVKYGSYLHYVKRSRKNWSLSSRFYMLGLSVIRSQLYVIPRKVPLRKDCVNKTNCKNYQKLYLIVESSLKKLKKLVFKYFKQHMVLNISLWIIKGKNLGVIETFFAKIRVKLKKLF